MNVSDIQARSTRDALQAALRIYGVAGDDASICVLADEAELRRLLVTTPVGLLDATHQPIRGHPLQAWALDTHLYEWARMHLNVSTHTVRESWDGGRYVTKVTLAVPELGVEVEDSDASDERSRGLPDFISHALKHRTGVLPNTQARDPRTG